MISEAKVFVYYLSNFIMVYNVSKFLQVVLFAEKSYQAALTQVSSKVSYITHGSMVIKFHSVLRIKTFLN